MKHTVLLIIIFIAGILYSCNNYLDVVPDNVATIENAFADRNEAEKFLYTCYSYIPDLQTVNGNIGLMASDELWSQYPTGSEYPGDPWFIARGEQNVNNPIAGSWNGNRGAKPLYRGIRDCNIFLENVGDYGKVSNLTATMRQRWLGEVMFLKAYYHYWLFRQYGPIVIIDKNKPISAPPEEVKEKRMPVDSVVNYISSLLDEAVTRLPDNITYENTELGRITKPVALTLKAKLWVLAASPLFNGNPDYVGFVDKDGVQLINITFDMGKWEKAVDATAEAIDACEAIGIRLYEFDDILPFENPELSNLKMTIRNSFAGKWNSETIWGLSGRRANSVQRLAMSRLDPQYPLNVFASRDLINPTLEIVDKFYTENGVPIDEDKEWHYATQYDIMTVKPEDRYNLIEGYQLAALHFDREARFYADLAHDGSRWFMQSNGTDADAWTVKARLGGQQSQIGADRYSTTGYWPKKLVNWKFVIGDGGNYTLEEYAWPEFRLSDLYLLYAEALNEVGRSDEAIVYIDKVRERAGLDGVVVSWTNYSTNPTKYQSKEGLREIIHRERTIELVFEGHRFWDLLRWKEADRELNTPITGWSRAQETAEGYYHPQVLFDRKFVAPRDYLWPLREYDLIVNPNLVQNPGWGMK